MIDLKINGIPVQMTFKPHAYKQDDRIIIRLSENFGNAEEAFVNDEIGIYKNESGEVVGIIIKKFTDLEDFKSK